MPHLTIDALGVPRPQGSIAYKGLRGGKPIMVSDNAADLKPWRGLIAAAARSEVEFAELQPLDEPVRLDVLFWLPRPKRPRFEVPATKPDLDKLMRAVLDGLADGGLYVNDSRVFEFGRVGARYAVDREPGVRVVAWWGDDLDLD